METLRDMDVVRALTAAPLLRADDDSDDSLGVLEIKFSPFDTWYRIESWFEGTFLERTIRGAFRKTIAERSDQIRVLYDHGMDFHIGNKVIGRHSLLKEEKAGPRAEVPIYDTSYNRDLLPGLRDGAYGSSFRFRVIKDEWNDEPGKSSHNSEGIPERTIKEVRLYEFGPVTFPANPAATAGVRSATDDYLERLRSVSPSYVEELSSRASKLRTPTVEPAAPRTGDPDGAAPSTVDEPAERHSRTAAQRRALLIARGL